MKQVIAFMLFSTIVQAQNLSLVGVSPSYSLTGKLAPKIAYNINLMSVINATNQTIDGKLFPSGQAHFLQTGMLIYQLNKQFSVGGGYTHGNHNIFGLKESEHRFLAQTSYQTKFNKLVFSNRLRYELRYPFNEKTAIRSRADVVRYQFWLTYPLYDPRASSKGFFLSASNEVFLYLKGAINGPVSSKNGGLWSENWSHIGGGYNAGRTRIELGYCFQSLVRNQAKDYRFFNLLQVNLYSTLNWDDVQFWWYQ
jgi:Protein of unknown function (DUF2490)